MIPADKKSKQGLRLYTRLITEHTIQMGHGHEYLDGFWQMGRNIGPEVLLIARLLLRQEKGPCVP